jgi:hypothetical protein
MSNQHDKAFEAYFDKKYGRHGEQYSDEIIEEARSAWNAGITHTTAISNVEPEIKIVILDRGFVFVGYVTQTETEMYIDKARCIRKWGTTNGLGELKNGPTKETVLDAICTVRPLLRAVLFTVDCNQSKWKPHLV